MAKKMQSAQDLASNAKSKAMEGYNRVKSKINSSLPSTMNKASDLTGMSMPTSRKQLKTTTANRTKIKAAANKAVKNWSSQNKGMSTAKTAIKKAMKKTGMNTELYSKDLTKGLKKTGSYKGEPNKLGGGGRFKQLTDKLEAQGKSASSAKAIAASIGRKKYGKAKMSNWAAKGKKGK